MDDVLSTLLMSRIIDAPSEMDWIEVCDLYQDTQDRMTSEVMDAVLEMTPEFISHHLEEMYSLPDDFSDFTPLPDISDLDIPF